MIQETCRREQLARGGSCQVELCSCGSIHLSVGPLTLRLDASSFRALCAVLEVARQRLAAKEEARPRC